MHLLTSRDNTSFTDAFLNPAEVYNESVQEVCLILILVFPDVRVVAIFVNYVVSPLVSFHALTPVFNDSTTHAFNIVAILILKERLIVYRER